MIRMSHEPHERANWSIKDTNLLLYLTLQQKNLCHWSARNPTKFGWANITHGLYAQSNSRYTSKQMQNKWHDCRMDLSGPTTSVGTRTDYSVGPWDYPTCAARYLLA
jgi:hypothetical protein